MCAAATTLFFIAKISVASATETIVSVPVRSSLRVKKQKSRKQKQSSGDQQSVADLRKLYDNLQKEHERVGSAFQNLKDQNEELARDLRGTWQNAKFGCCIKRKQRG